MTRHPRIPVELTAGQGRLSYRRQARPNEFEGVRTGRFSEEGRSPDGPGGGSPRVGWRSLSRPHEPSTRPRSPRADKFAQKRWIAQALGEIRALVESLTAA